MREHFIVLACGSRDWHSLYEINVGLLMAEDLARDRGQRVLLVTGGAKGADSIAESTARSMGIEVEVVPAQWSTYGKRAGFLRNKQMIEMKPDLVLAYQAHGSRGTQHTIDLAEGAGLPCWIWRLTFEKVGDIE